MLRCCLLEALGTVECLTVDLEVVHCEIVGDGLLRLFRLRVHFRPLVRFVIDLKVLRQLQKKEMSKVVKKKIYMDLCN